MYDTRDNNSIGGITLMKFTVLFFRRYKISHIYLVYKIVFSVTNVSPTFIISGTNNNLEH